MGYHQVTTASAAMTAGRVIYDGCRFYNQSAGVGASGLLRWTGGSTPRYQIRDCIGGVSALPDARVPA
jgi:hypothetical protein